MTTTAPKGFRAAGVAAGLKSSGAADLAVVVNDGPRYTAAAVFTANRVVAAPVRWSRRVVSAGLVRAVVLNSGGANACTGPQGVADTQATAAHAAKLLGDLSADEIAVCSTGLIGELLPMGKVFDGVRAAIGELAPQGGQAAAEAIMTTDTTPKTVIVAGDGYTVGGMAKGAGMLAPSLATMLVVLTTDALLSAADADTALRAATRVTFDRLDSDGCMSTNDTVLLMASGASGVTPDLQEFTARVTAACADLAARLLGDAEGATKEITIEVVGAVSADEAVTVGRSVARNNLLKCALYGNDPNWGRVLAAIGTTDATFDPDSLDVAINGIWVCRSGYAAADRSTVDLSDRHVSITIDLHAGAESATVWTNDLSAAYVHENSAYSS